MVEAAIGAAAGLTAAAVGAWAALYARRPRKANVESVDAVLAPTARVEVLDAGTPTQMAPAVDVKMRNRGGEVAVLKRLTIEVMHATRVDVLEAPMPYEEIVGYMQLPPSGRYGVRLPPAEKALGTRLDIDISHVIEPGGAERLEVPVQTSSPTNFAWELTVAQPLRRFLVYRGSDLYVLRLSIVYNRDNQHAHFGPVAVVCPTNVLHVPTRDGITQSIHTFAAEVYELRQVFDRAMVARGLAAPNWTASPPRRRSDMPPNLPIYDAVRYRKLNDHFWDPQQAVAGYLQAAEHVCHQIIKGVPPEAPNWLSEAAHTAQATLDELPTLTEQLLRRLPI
jgi:hypothetical protein